MLLKEFESKVNENENKLGNKYIEFVEYMFKLRKEDPLFVDW